MFYFEGAIQPKEWRTSDLGFDEVLRTHLEKIGVQPLTDTEFLKVLEDIKYWEKSFYDPEFNFDPELCKNAEKRCRMLGIEGFSIGEGGA
jgi:hypothetical protein